MKHSKRTIRDSVYINALKEQGPISITQLAKEVSQSIIFRDTDVETIEKDLQRFADHYEAIESLTRKDGRLHWTQAEPKFDGPTQHASQAPLMLTSKGFLTGKAGVTCEHCGRTIDLTQVEPHWRVKNRLFLLALQEYHYFRATCPKCGWEGKYDAGKDVMPIL